MQSLNYVDLFTVISSRLIDSNKTKTLPWRFVTNLLYRRLINTLYNNNDNNNLDGLFADIRVIFIRNDKWIKAQFVCIWQYVYAIASMCML